MSLDQVTFLCFISELYVCANNSDSSFSVLEEALHMHVVKALQKSQSIGLESIFELSE